MQIANIYAAGQDWLQIAFMIALKDVDFNYFFKLQKALAPYGSTFCANVHKNKTKCVYIRKTFLKCFKNFEHR